MLGSVLRFILLLIIIAQVSFLIYHLHKGDLIDFPSNVNR